MTPLLLSLMAILLVLGALGLAWKFRRFTKTAEGPSATFPPAPNEPPWTGWRRFKVRKRVEEDAGSTFVSFYLCPVNRRRLPAFEPGQFVQLRLEVPDSEHPDRMKDVIRPYYLSDSANGRYYRILVQRIDDGTGEAAQHLIDHLQKGDVVELSAPEGDCPIVFNDPRSLVILGTGAGIAPMVALCNTLIDRKILRPVHFYYAMRNEGELIFLPNLEYAAGHMANARFELCFSERMPEGTVDGAVSGDGVVYRKAALGTAFLRKSLNLAEHVYYICGPGEPLDALAADLGALGVPAQQIARAPFSTPPSTQA